VWRVLAPDLKELEMLTKTECFRSVAVLALAALVGCGAQSPAPPTAAARPAATQAGAQYLLTSEPAGVRSILQVREESKQGDEVVLVGRIGGDINPWVEGRAAFSLVDLSAKACSDIPGDNCPTPWDYCCETDKLVKGKILIKFVGSDGKPVATDARELLGVKELDTLVVQGQAQRDDSGNLTILASNIFVRPAGASPAANATEHDHDHDHGHDHEGEGKAKLEAEPVTTSPPTTTTESAPND
jgi:hypothetical protein